MHSLVGTLEALHVIMVACQDYQVSNVDSPKGFHSMPLNLTVWVLGVLPIHP